MTGPSDDHAFAAFAAENESGLNDGNNGKTARITQDTARNAPFRHVPKILNNLCTTIHCVLFGCAKRQHGHENDAENGEYFFHWMYLVR